MKKKIVKGIFAFSVFGLLVLGNTTANAGATVKGWISGSYHPVPVLKDNFTAYTSISRPSKEQNSSKMKANMTIKVYNASGSYNSGSDSVSGGCAWDLPINCGAKASIRNAHKAVGTHKAKNYDANYQWVSTLNSVWNR